MVAIKRRTARTSGGERTCSATRRVHQRRRILKPGLFYLFFFFELAGQEPDFFSTKIGELQPKIQGEIAARYGRCSLFQCGATIGNHRRRARGCRYHRILSWR